ncbi:hypothetical protein OESDEN_17360, partial [Oesophagostomum dentatum]
LQRGIPTPNGTPPSVRCTNEVPPDRGRSKSLQEPCHGLYRHVWADSCPSIEQEQSVTPAMNCPRDITKPKRSLPCITTSTGIPLQVQIFRRRRWLPQTPSFEGDLDSNGNSSIERKRQQFQSSMFHSVDLGHFDE